MFGGDRVSVECRLLGGTPSLAQASVMVGEQQAARGATNNTASGAGKISGQAICRPADTRDWVYFYDTRGELWQRKRRWVRDFDNPRAVQEMMTQGEWDRRVDSPSWPDYKPEEEYEEDDHVPEEHGGGSDRPNAITDMNEGCPGEYDYTTVRVKQTSSAGVSSSK